MCVTSEQCVPLFRPEPKFGKHVTMVLVQPVSSTETWGEVIESAYADDYRKYVPIIIFPFLHFERILHCFCTTLISDT